ncbi:MAG: DNA topoisomerase 3 [Opitutales bacterium]
MKKLVIAEKPSVAGDIARVLGKMRRVDDFYENDEYVVSSAVGHLVELCMPADIDKKYGRWAIADLPILPEKFTLKPIEKTKKKLNSLKSLLARKDIDAVYNACDAGREGELIFTYIYEITKCKKERKRLWFSSMTADAIRSAFDNMRSQDEMESLQDAARSRAEADWLIGINGTRAITTRMFGSRGKNVISVGRVQTPTLAMIVDRQAQIDNFKPSTFWKIVADFGVESGTYEGTYQKPNFKAEKDSIDKIDRLWTLEDAENILKEISEAKEGIAVDKKTKSTKSAPRLYDLTTLQREANNRFSLPATKTLSIAQSLYEKHKMITYPRTDSTALPEDYVPTVLKTLGSLGGQYEVFAKKALAENYVKGFNKKIFNNKKVSDHFAIIPTGQFSASLNADEEKVYDMITRRFISAFYPDAIFDVTVRTTTIAEHNFKTEGKILNFAGYLEVYNKQDAADKTIPALTGDSEKAILKGASINEDATKPPAKYTEATLLTAMETAGKLVDDEELADAMKEKGLGTPATRAQIIENLIMHKLLERQKRDLVPTAKAQSFILFLKTVGIEELTSPQMTGEWENQLRLVERKTLTRMHFMKGISDMTTKLVELTKNFNESDTDTVETNIPSPTGDGMLLETFRAYKSKDGAFQVFKTIGNRKFSEEEIRTLVGSKRIGPLDGFRSKMGKPYEASLLLDENFKIKFEFSNSNSDDSSEDNSDFDITKAPVIAEYPEFLAGADKEFAGSKIIEAPKSYITVKDGEILKTAFRLSKVMLSHKFTNEEVATMLSERKSPLIEDFVSKRTNKKFSAFLILDNKGSLKFEFPPRQIKEKVTTKKVAKKKATSVKKITID